MRNNNNKDCEFRLNSDISTQSMNSGQNEKFFGMKTEQTRQENLLSDFDSARRRKLR